MIFTYFLHGCKFSIFPVLVAWIFLKVFSKAQHICLCKEQTAADISTTLKTKPRILNWLSFSLYYSTHDAFIIFKEEDFLQHRRTKVVAVGLIVTNGFP